MYDGFSDTGKHFAEWVQITKEFLKLAFVGGHREASCPCSRCENKRMLSEYEMFAHLTKKEFMSNYLLWHQHESNGNDDVDRMDDMVADIGRGYDLKSEYLRPEVQNFYKLLTASEEKMHDDIYMTVLQVVTHLIAFKSKYSFSNKCYNDNVKLIIDLISTKHNMPKDIPVEEDCV
jgi:hypothetical protein